MFCIFTQNSKGDSCPTLCYVCPSTVSFCFPVKLQKVELEWNGQEVAAGPVCPGSGIEDARWACLCKLPHRCASIQCKLSDPCVVADFDPAIL